MMQNEHKRLDLLLHMKNPFDYEDFCNECANAHTEPLPILEYAQKMGMLFVAMNQYPDDAPQDAYLRLVIGGAKNVAPVATPEVTKPIAQPSLHRTCCGGGKVK